MSEDGRDRVAALAVILVGLFAVVGLTTLVLDIAYDIIPDDASAALAGFIAGLISIMAYGVARWLDQRTSGDE